VPEKKGVETARSGGRRRRKASLVRPGGDSTAGGRGCGSRGEEVKMKRRPVSFPFLEQKSGGSSCKQRGRNEIPRPKKTARHGREMWCCAGSKPNAGAAGREL